MTGRHRGPAPLPSTRRIVVVATLGAGIVLGSGTALAACGSNQPVRHPRPPAHGCDTGRCADRSPLGDAIGRALTVGGGDRG